MANESSENEVLKDGACHTCCQLCSGILIIRDNSPARGTETNFGVRDSYVGAYFFAMGLKSNESILEGSIMELRVRASVLAFNDGYCMFIRNGQ